MPKREHLGTHVGGPFGPYGCPKCGSKGPNGSWCDCEGPDPNPSSNCLIF